MVPSETVKFARNFAVMVRVRGPVSFSFSLFSNAPRNLLSSFTQLAINFSGPKRVEDEETRFSSIPVSNPTRDLILLLFIRSFVFYELMMAGFGFLLLGMRSSGETTLSASGMLVPDTLYDAQVATRLYGDNCEDRVLVVTVASVVEPFLSPQQRENIPKVGVRRFCN